MVVCPCIPAILETEVGGLRLKAGKCERPYLKSKGLKVWLNL
jgi:hypothetical protein